MAKLKSSEVAEEEESLADALAVLNKNPHVHRSCDALVPREPQRIVSLVPSLSESLEVLGLGARGAAVLLQERDKRRLRAGAVSRGGEQGVGRGATRRGAARRWRRHLAVDGGKVAAVIVRAELLGLVVGAPCPARAKGGG